MTKTTKKQAYDRAWVLKNPEKVAAARARYHAKHREDRLAQNKAWYANKEKATLKAKKWRYKTKYGITLEQFEQMFVAQDKKCAAYRTSEPRHKNGWVVDHNHLTDKVRGILCRRCNISLGNAEDNPLHLYALISYLDKFNG